LIDRLAMVQTHLARMDERMFREGELTEHSSRVYLAWANSASRMLQALGLQATKPPANTPSLHQIIAAHAARKAAGE
jgi:hypothetical protein